MMKDERDEMFRKVSLGILFVSRNFTSLSSLYLPLKTSRSLTQIALLTTAYDPWSTTTSKSMLARTSGIRYTRCMEPFMQYVHWVFS